MTEDELIETLAQFEADPYGFVIWAFPWGEPGTPLEHEELEEWQVALLKGIGEDLRKGLSLQDALNNVIMPVRYSRSTGHGVGKSAVAAMLTWWAMSTMVDTKGVVTANTETQLKTKTWPEIAKWHRMFIAKDFFEMTATAIFPRDPVHARTWRIDIVPWSEKNTEAFAGLHNISRRIFVLFDEASAIPDSIHEVTEGAMTDTDTQIIWVMFGNPTKNTGRFRETAPDGRFGARWNFQSLDSRTVRRTNKKQIEEWIEDYGDDSDFVRIRVKGEFPRADLSSFIGLELAKEACLRKLPDYNQEGLILGVDVARFGDDASVIYARRGRDARTIPPRRFMGMDSRALTMKVYEAIWQLNPVVVCVDGGGIGGAIVDGLRELRPGCLIVEVTFGGKPDDFSNEKYANKRAEIWGQMREWLKTGCVNEFIQGSDKTLVDQLTGPMYALNQQDAIQLEKKSDMKKRGVPSPDDADALACTFAMPIPLVTNPHAEGPLTTAHVPDYDPLEV